MDTLNTLPDITEFLQKNHEKLLFPLKGGNNGAFIDDVAQVAYRDKQEINRLMHNKGYLPLREDIDDLHMRWTDTYRLFDWHWLSQRKDDKLQGTLTKRISKLFYETKGIKLSAEELTQIGNLAKRSMLMADNLAVDFTDDFSWSAGDYADDDSCFFGDRWMCRGTIQLAGGYAMRVHRSYQEENYYSKQIETYYEGQARAWLVPNCPEVGSAILFNVYSEINQRAFARLAALTLTCSLGIEYDMICYIDLGIGAYHMWVNGDECIVVAPKERLETINQVYGDDGITLDWQAYERRAIISGLYEVERYDDDDDDDNDDY